MLTVGDLFSGIGGFSLGLERAGMRTAWFAEIDPFASAVLRKHWPEVPNHGDVRSVRAGAVERVDVLCGGFPCQDVSVAGSGAGLDGERSGLWREYARIIGDLRPRYVVVENVAALLGRGIGRVLGDLAALGFDAEWHCIPASAVGAPHRRDRVWVVAYANKRGCGRLKEQNVRPAAGIEAPRRCDAERLHTHVADADEPRLAQRIMLGLVPSAEGRGNAGENVDMGSWWRVEPDVGRVANGVPSRVDRLKCLGNAVVPQIVEMIGRAIMEVDQCANSR